ncbi:MAG TPA: hypothetical protein VFV86_06435 [Nitrososphaeraceae archaeon]|nr:hypothetical protein [Nitrososphaeraceae archaeon]
MNKYKLLPIPKDSAWDRRSFYKRYAPWWLKEFVRSIHNIIRWFPIIWKDRDWDHVYILEILKKKIEFQREYLITNNRHVDIDRDNRDMTICLNLIDKFQEEYYLTEYQDYHESEMNFVPLEDNPGFSEIKFVELSEKYNEYFNKYKGAYKKLTKTRFKGWNNPNQKSVQALALAHYNHERCKSLLFRILKERCEFWWN